MEFLIFLSLSAFRLLSVFAVQTFFSPDEYWQSLEVAHKLAFGYGHLTWEWKQGIRSYLHPVVISIIYKILAALNLDSVSALILVPRVAQALVSAYADYRFFVWSGRKKWSLFIIVSSWFWFFTASRTLINTMEASLTTIALSFFPWGNAESTGFLWVVGLLAFIRPTSIITWLPICIHHIRKSRYTVWELLFKRYLFIGLILSSALVALDSFYHGSLLIVPIEFFKVNVLQNIGSFYGSHPIYWYFTSGFPAVLGICIIPFYLAVFDCIKSWNESKSRQVILMSIIFTIFVYSLLPHKEFRFLLQILPLCLHIVSKFLSDWSRTKSTATIWFVVSVILAANVIPAGYLGFVHQQGTIKVMDKIVDIANNYKTNEGRPPKVFFMMPCHSTPFYSHVHANISMRFLTCEPNFKGEKNYLDEADKFFEAPMKWIRSQLPVHPVSALPTHCVVFDTLAPKISDFLSIYKPLEVFFHSDYLLSSRGGKNVIIYERVDQNLKRDVKNEPDEIVDAAREEL